MRLPSPRILPVVLLFELKCAISEELPVAASVAAAAAEAVAAVGATAEGIAPPQETVAPPALRSSGVVPVQPGRPGRAITSLRGTRHLTDAVLVHVQADNISAQSRRKARAIQGNAKHAATTAVAAGRLLNISFVAATPDDSPTNESDGPLTFETCDMACEQCFADHYQGCLAFCKVGCDDLCEVRLERPMCEEQQRWVATVDHIFNAMQPSARMCQATGINGCPRRRPVGPAQVPHMGPYAAAERGIDGLVVPTRQTEKNDTEIGAAPSDFDEISSSESVRAAMASAAQRGASPLRPVAHYASG
eukprot:TRINITY_DN14101_c0_g1_i1.p1 TRINITY_DN14101_c0_g1~~TRINITY_DN14101_c0_g1_i1.p1  ORF type:complete len:305 (+),score=47.57 TRINITY_DN14101_c0_g1_i1:184-1098(+)